MKTDRNVLLIVSAILLSGIILISCTKKDEKATANNSDNSSAAIPDGVNKKLTIACVMEFANSPVSVGYIKGVKEQALECGVDIFFYDANFDPIKQVDLVNNAINQNVDAIMVSLGKPDPLTPAIKKAIEKGIKVVSMDCELKIPGVTIIEQNDHEMARLTLEAMVNDIGGKGNIVKIWVPGFAPMEKRQIVYDSIMKANPDIKEIAAFGTASNTTMLQTEEQMAAILRQHKKGTIQAVWASWDEYAKGASKAIMAAGRDEIKVYGIDITNEDLQMMQAKGSPWVATTAVDTKFNGVAHMRLMLMHLAGETLPERVYLSPLLLRRTDLPEEIVIADSLGKFIKGWGDKGEYYKPWMKVMKNRSNK